MQRTALCLYCLAMVISPLLFASVHTYAYTLVFGLILVGSLFLVADCFAREHPGGRLGFVLPRTPLAFLFLIVIALIILQMCPLPEVLLSRLSPMAAKVNRMGVPPADLVAGQGENGLWSSLAPYLYPTRQALIRWTAYGLFFLGLVRLLSTERRLLTVASLLVAVACFEAIYGFFQAFSDHPGVWWAAGVTDRQAVTGTHLNRNHFAGYMVLGVLLAFSLAAALSPAKTGQQPRTSMPIRVRLIGWLSAEENRAKQLCLLFAGLIMGLGVIFSASRGGILSLAGGLFCLGLFFVLRRRLRRPGWVILGGCLLILFYALHMGVDYPLQRFGSINASFEDRLRLTECTLDLFAAYPLFGVGLGNFASAFPKYQAPEDARYFISHAHNDWAQFLAEAGMVGMGIVLIGIVLCVVHILQIRRRQRDILSSSLGILPLAALTAAGLHAFVDFNLHLPANCLALAAVLAVGHNALSVKKADSPVTFFPLLSWTGLSVCGIIILILWSGSWTVRHFMAEAYCNTVPNSTLNRDMDPPLDEIKAAMAWDDWNAAYPRKYALKLMFQGSSNALPNFEKEPRDSDRMNTHVDDATNHDRLIHSLFNLFPDHQLSTLQAKLEQSLRLNPFHPSVHLLLSQVYLQRAFMDERSPWLDRADISARNTEFLANKSDQGIHISLETYRLLRSRVTSGDISMEYK